MTTTRWDTVTGELVIRCDATTAHELWVALGGEPDNDSNLSKLYKSLSNTMCVKP